MIEAIKLEKRQRLFVCGFWLDNAVSAAALDAYVEGFDVHIIVDISPAKNIEHGKIALDRLLQIGILPISTQQLFYEWMANTADKNVSKQLQKLVDMEH